MTSPEPIICFGQQPCGFFPKRFLAAKINTAKKLRDKIGGRIVFFYHDSDADYRETITILRDRFTGGEARLNFTQENKLQKKFSPLYAKRIPVGWKEEILKQLPRFIPLSPPSPSGGGIKGESLMDIFQSTDEKTAADFCLEIYKKVGLLHNVEIVRSGGKTFREAATELDKDCFADVQYQSEIVRARLIGGKLALHEGGGKYLTLPDQPVEKWQKSAARDQRFLWMQSVISCSHYICGEGEKEYLDVKAFPAIQFIDREKIDQPEYAWLG